MHADSSSHPLLDPPTLEHGLPRFADIDGDVLREAFPEALRRHCDQIREIATQKLPDLNANDVEAAMQIVEGTARSMGVDVN